MIEPFLSRLRVSASLWPVEVKAFPMTQYGYALLGLTAIVAVLVAVLTFAVLKFVGGRSRCAAAPARRRRGDATLLSAAHAGRGGATARAGAGHARPGRGLGATEQSNCRQPDRWLAGRRIEDGRVEILNRAGRRMLEIDGDAVGT